MQKTSFDLTLFCRISNDEKISYCIFITSKKQFKKMIRTCKISLIFHF
jgi:hypothetical protein